MYETPKERALNRMTCNEVPQEARSSAQENVTLSIQEIL